jgi:hypothetical protein
MKKILTIFLFIFSIILYGQEYHRLSADFTVKIKDVEGKLTLTKGKVFYDKNYQELIYDIHFPEKEKWIMKDTLLTKVKNNKIISQTTIPGINDFTIFHLALNVSLNNFGLENTIYQLVKLEKKNGLVISYWKIPQQTVEGMDHIIIAKRNNRLENVIIVGENDKIISKQYFRNYLQIGAFQFPQKVIQINYDIQNRKNFQVYEFKNITVNDFKNDKLYHLSLN